MRFLVRVLGFLFVAAGFVTLVIDGTRALADARFGFTSVEALVAPLAGAGLASVQAAAQGLHPLLWDPVLVTLLKAPAAAVGLVLGFLLIRLGQRPAEPIGFDTKR